MSRGTNVVYPPYIDTFDEFKFSPVIHKGIILLTFFSNFNTPELRKHLIKMNSLNSHQKKALESLFCPPLDSALVTLLSNEHGDFDECFEVLDSLAKAANHVLDSERVCESEISSENANSNYKSGSSGSSEPSSGENDKGDGSITSLEFSMDGFSFSEDYDSESICLTNDEIPLDEEIEQYNYNFLPEDQDETIGSPTEFLKSCFPMLSETKIKSLFQENDNDVEIVLDVVLNELEQEKELTQPYALSPSPSSSSSSYLTLKSDENDHNSLITESRSKHRKKKRRKKPKQKNVILQNGSLGPHQDLSCNSSSPPEVNYEYQHEYDDNRDPIILNDDQQEPMDDLIKLIDLFPDHEIESLEASLVAADGLLQNAIYLLLGPEEFNMTCPNKSNKSKNKSPQIQQQSILPKKAGLNFKTETENVKVDEFQVVNRSKKNQKKISSNFTSIPSITISSPATTRFHNLSGGNSGDDEEYEEHDPQHCRQMAQDYKIKRNEAFKNACNAYQKSKGSRNGDGGIAFHYSTEGRRFELEMKKWNLRAARSMVQRKCKEKGILDLHGLTVEEALTVTKEQLNKWYKKKSMTKYTNSLKIITGLGKHSPNGIAKLPPAIKRFLAKENWDFSEHQGYVLVKGLKNGY
ncbi:hypothetical protein Glove_216g87 [Diversispora epigaea]|uniref:Smr domain-containing protein n=1 Tax=Diversispora epigaea TaxID=1348612 RepID=A0A397IQ24_9GLOM|nr:hypothetical protein Glove_216g87 [Diversispora epigaea]